MINQLNDTLTQSKHIKTIHNKTYVSPKSDMQIRYDCQKLMTNENDAYCIMRPLVESDRPHCKGLIHVRII